MNIKKTSKQNETDKDDLIELEKIDKALRRAYRRTKNRKLDPKKTQFDFDVARYDWTIQTIKVNKLWTLMDLYRDDDPRKKQLEEETPNLI